MTKRTLLDMQLYNNSIYNWIFSTLVAVIVFVLLTVLRRMLLNRVLQEGEEKYTGAVAAIRDAIEQTYFWYFFIVACYLASIYLVLSDKWIKQLYNVFVIGTAVQCGIWASSLIRNVLSDYLGRRASEDAASAGAFSILNFLSQVLVWSLVLLLALDNLGANVTALVAGLGIGGMAVALATQNILSDLFASLSIVLDRPFVVGDFVIFGDIMGTVEYIGIKTTRIRSLSGEQIVCTNGDLLGSRIRNFKRMQERRVVFTVGIVYQTPAEQLEIIPGLIREAIEAQSHTRFDRAHFKSFGDFSLNYEIVYYVLVPDYNVYMDIQQTINLSIYRKFEELGIEFAYPTQTVFLGQPVPGPVPVTAVG